jgi:hypothetical protein
VGLGFFSKHLRSYADCSYWRKGDEDCARENQLGDIGRDLPRLGRRQVALLTASISRLRYAGGVRQREPVVSFQLMVADLVNPTEYETECQG